MKGRTHLTLGLGIGGVASVTQPLEAVPIILIASGVASLAPDLDGNNLLNKRVTKSAKHIKKSGVFVGTVMIGLSFITYFLDANMLSFLDESWFRLQNIYLFFGLGVVLVGFSLRSQETVKNILMSIIGLFLLYYAATIELWWLVLFALYIGGVGWFAHRGPTHTIWAVIYWWYMSYLLEINTEVEHLAMISTIAYLSHIVGDMLTKQGLNYSSLLPIKYSEFVCEVIFKQLILFNPKRGTQSNLGGVTLKRINYRNPKVASYLLLGSLFMILGFSKDFFFFLLGMILIFGGIKTNHKLS